TSAPWSGVVARLVRGIRLPPHNHLGRPRLTGQACGTQPQSPNWFALMLAPFACRTDARKAAAQSILAADHFPPALAASRRDVGRARRRRLFPSGRRTLRPDARSALIAGGRDKPAPAGYTGHHE